MDIVNMKKELARLTKRANSRLRQLEKSSLTSASNAYRYIEKLENLDDEAVTLDKKGRIKFKTSYKYKKYEKQNVEHRLKVVQEFLQAKTSTVTGTKNKYEKAYKTATGASKIDKNFDTWSYAFSEGLFKKMSENFDSNTVIDILVEKLNIGQLTKEKIDELMNFINEQEENNLEYSIMDVENEFEKVKDENSPF